MFISFSTSLSSHPRSPTQCLSSSIQPDHPIGGLKQNRSNENAVYCLCNLDENTFIPFIVYSCKHNFNNVHLLRKIHLQALPMRRILLESSVTYDGRKFQVWIFSCFPKTSLAPSWKLLSRRYTNPAVFGRM